MGFNVLLFSELCMSNYYSDDYILIIKIQIKFTDWWYVTNKNNFTYLVDEKK